jgi:quercetin dioxygenase-like cupin family protein
MKVFTFSDVEAKEADEGASKLRVRWLITKEMGAPNFAMRLFEMEPDGNSPLHTHPWEHEVFILEGEGIVVAKDGEKKVKAGSVIFIAPNELHQIKNNSEKILELFLFLCSCAS